MQDKERKAYQDTVKVLAVTLCKERGLAVNNENVSSIIRNAKAAAEKLCRVN